MKKNKHAQSTSKGKSPLENPGKLITSNSKLQPSLIRSLGLLVALIGILCYLQTLSFKYTLDDFSIIKENHVTTKGVSAIGTIFSTPYRYGYTTQGDPLYRPVPKSIFAILWSLAPNNPLPAHLLNILLYGLTGFLLFFTLAQYLGGQLYIPFITSLLFMAHPIHSEVVANIKSLDEILSLLFFILSLYWIHRYLLTSKIKSMLAASIAYFIALLSKESAVTFIAVVPLALYFFTDAKTRVTLRITMWMLIPVVIMLAIRAFIFKGFVVAPPPVADNMLMLAAADFLAQKATAIYLLGYYLKLLILPFPLVFDYSIHQFDIVHAGNWKFLLSLTVYAAMAIYAVITFKKKNLVAFGILFFLITISLSSNLFRLIGTHFAERLLYAPSLGFCIVIAWLLTKIPDQKGEVKQKFNTPSLFFRARPNLMSIAAVFTIVLALKTVTQNPVWHNNLSLFKHGVQSSPNSMRTHYYLGNYLIEGDYYNSLPATEQVKTRNRGINELKKSISIYPYAEAYHSLGIAHYLMHEYDSSLYYYNAAIKLAPYIATYHNNMATVYFEIKQIDKAFAECQQAVQLDPNYAEAFCNLGSIYGSMNKMDEAMVNFEKAIAIDPNHARANYYIGKVLQASSKPEDQSRAKQYLDKARALDPKYSQ